MKNAVPFIVVLATICFAGYHIECRIIEVLNALRDIARKLEKPE